MDLRRLLLEGKVENVKETLSAIEKTEENHNFLSEFYTECEVKGISLDPKSIQVIIDFIVEYRLIYYNNKGILNYEENLSERMKFLQEILEDYLNHNYENPIEEFVLLKCVARILKPIENHPFKITLQKVQFMVCVYVAVKSDRKRDQYKFIDDFFKVLVHEDLIRDVLQLMLTSLKENSFKSDKWIKFNQIHSILQMYYLLLRAAHYYNIIDKNSDINDKESNRALQVVGECCLQISRLRYDGFNDTFYPLCEVEFFATVLSIERNKLSHFRKIVSEKDEEILADPELKPINVQKLGLFILDMIQMTRIEMEKIAVEDYKTFIEIENVQKLYDRVKDLRFQKHNLPIVDIEKPSQYMDKEIELLSKFGLVDNYTTVLLSEISEQMKRSYHNDFEENKLNVFSFIEWFQKNYQKPIDCVKNKLNAISEKSFIDITTLMTLFIKLLPESEKVRNMRWFRKFKKIHTDFVTNPDLNFSREESVIEEFLEKIRLSISNPKDQEKFNELEKILLKKRSLTLEFKIFKDLKSVVSDWPKDDTNLKLTGRTISSYKDPLSLFMQNIDKNISDYKNIELFLKEVKWKNTQEIVHKVRKVIFKDLSKSLDSILCSFEGSIILDCLQILRKITQDLSQDDYFRNNPVVMALRNTLTTLFCRYKNNEKVDESILVVCAEVFTKLEIESREHDTYLKSSIFKDHVNTLETKIRNFGKNEIADEIYLIDCLEILKKMEIELSQDYNYLDFDCPIPVARNLRNVLAHGDIYVDIFCPNLKEVIQSHLRTIYATYENLNGIGFCRLDDFEEVRSDLVKQRYWARQAWEALHFNETPQQNQVIETFKVRDHNDLTVVHYNLKNITEDNKFLMYLIDKLTQVSSFQTNVLFDKMLEESKNYNYTEYNTEQFFIDNFINEEDLQNRRWFLCLILCFNCQSLDIFYKIYSNQFNTLELLSFTMAHNLKKITEFLLTQIIEDANFDNYSLVLMHAITSDNTQLVLILMNIIPDKSNINWQSLVILAAELGNTEILELLFTEIDPFSFSDRNLLIKTTISFNSDISVLKLVFEKYLFSLSNEEFQFLVHLCCFNERYGILKYLIEVISENQWKAIKNSILISYFNNHSTKIVQYLIEKGASFNSKTLAEFVPFFESSKIVEVLFEHFGTSELHETSTLTYVRNQDVAEVFLKKGYSLDWFEINSLPLKFVLEKNPGPKVYFEKLRFFLRRSSFENVGLLINYFKRHKLLIQFMDLPELGLDIRLRKRGWMSQLDWRDPDQEDFDVIFGRALKKKYLTYVRMVLRRGRKLYVDEGLDTMATNGVKYYKQDQIMEMIKEYGPDSNIKYDTLLRLAIERGKGDITDSMRIFSKYGAGSPYGINFHKSNPQDWLLFGVLHGKKDLIQNALSSGADINFRYEKFRFGTILHITSYKIELRKKEFRNYIFNFGVDPSIKDIENSTAYELDLFYNPSRKILRCENEISAFHLFWAGVLRNDIDLMTEALDKGANVNCLFPGVEYYTALHYFAHKGSLKGVKFLLNNGADPLIANYAQDYPIKKTLCRDYVEIFKLLFTDKLELGRYFVNAAFENSVKIVQFLLEKGVDPNSKRNEKSALVMACEEPNNTGLKLAQLLIKHKAKVTESHASLALDNKNYEVAKLILYEALKYPKTVDDFKIAIEEGLNINVAPYSDLRTFLHLACYLQDKEMVKFLLDNGADLLKKDSKFNDPIKIALESNSEIAKLFFKPLLCKFYSMWSKYPSKEFTDFYNHNSNLHLDLVFVFWFDMILKVSGLLQTEHKNLNAFELMVSGLWLSNIGLIRKFLKSGGDINCMLRELVFVGCVLNYDNENLDKTLKFVSSKGGAVSKEIACAKKLAQQLLDLAVPFCVMTNYEWHPYFKKAIELYKSKTDCSQCELCLNDKK